jgi:hypothetical protein
MVALVKMKKMMRGGQGTLTVFRLSGKTLSLWMINVVKDDISEGEEDE